MVATPGASHVTRQLPTVAQPLLAPHLQLSRMVSARNANSLGAPVLKDTYKRGQCAFSAPKESTRLKLIAPPMRAAASALIVLQARQPHQRGSIWPQVLMPRRQTPFARIPAVKWDTT